MASGVLDKHLLDNRIYNLDYVLLTLIKNVKPQTLVNHLDLDWDEKYRDFTTK